MIDCDEAYSPLSEMNMVENVGDLMDISIAPMVDFMQMDLVSVGSLPLTTPSELIPGILDEESDMKEADEKEVRFWETLFSDSDDGSESDSDFVVSPNRFNDGRKYDTLSGAFSVLRDSQIDSEGSESEENQSADSDSVESESEVSDMDESDSGGSGQSFKGATHSKFGSKQSSKQPQLSLVVNDRRSTSGKEFFGINPAKTIGSSQDLSGEMNSSSAPRLIATYERPATSGKSLPGSDLSKKVHLSQGVLDVSELTRPKPTSVSLTQFKFPTNTSFTFGAKSSSETPFSFNSSNQFEPITIPSH